MKLCFVVGYVLQSGGKIAHNVCLALWAKNQILLGKEGLFCWERRACSAGKGGPVLLGKEGVVPWTYSV